MSNSTAMIIEDDPDTAALFSTVLTMVGYEVETILSAKEALLKLAGQVPDLILMDMRLGFEISGADILYQIRSNPRLDNTRVIVITAYHKMAEPISDMADLILLKPVEIDQLKIFSERIGSYEVKSRKFQFRDPVTELFNLEFYMTRLELAFERAKRKPDFNFGCIIIRFLSKDKGLALHEIESSIEIIKQSSQRLKQFIRATDTVARYTSWDFATLHEDLKDPGDIEIIINRLTELLSKPYSMERLTFNVDVRMGAAVHNSLYKNPEDTLKAAAQALESAISSGHKSVYLINSNPTALY